MQAAPTGPRPLQPRQVAPGVIAPPPVEAPNLTRDPPRPPLSTLSLALPPRSKLAEGAKLLRPVAVESAMVESGGRRIAIAGAVSLRPDETCLSGTKSWPCGVHARTAFRLWLRGRTLDCDMPDVADRELVVAACRKGGQDAGAWLVGNGWARAAADGPYGEAEAAARRARLGIWGDAPDTGGLPPVPDAPLVTPSADQPVLAE